MLQLLNRGTDCSAAAAVANAVAGVSCLYLCMPYLSSALVQAAAATALLLCISDQAPATRTSIRLITMLICTAARLHATGPATQLLANPRYQSLPPPCCCYAQVTQHLQVSYHTTPPAVPLGCSRLWLAPAQGCCQLHRWPVGGYRCVECSGTEPRQVSSKIMAAYRAFPPRPLALCMTPA
jgi:hypothetical protein